MSTNGLGNQKQPFFVFLRAPDFEAPNVKIEAPARLPDTQKLYGQSAERVRPTSLDPIASPQKQIVAYLTRSAP
jgi:hypothetical protein